MTTAMSAHQEPPRERLASPVWPPTKRNKRKDFKPRCAPNAPLTSPQHVDDGVDSEPSHELDEDMDGATRLSEERIHTDDDDDISKCVKIGVKNLVLLKGAEAVDLSGRRISTDSNENIDTYPGSQHLLDFADHRKNTMNISSQFQQSYIESLQLPEQGKHILTTNSNISITPSEYKTKNFSTKSPFAISQLIKTNSPTRRRNSDNSEDLENDDGSLRNEEDGSGGALSPDAPQQDGQEPMEVDDAIEEEMQNGEVPSNNKVLSEYAVNTMKELLGIYGLSSNEVAEALTGQVRAIEALQAGKPYPLWLQHRWPQGAMNAMTAMGAPYLEDSEIQSPLDAHHRSNSIQENSEASGVDSDGDRTLDLSLSKDPDVQDLSASASSAGNSVAEFEQQTLLMRRNLEDLAGLHSIFSKPPSSYDNEDALSADLRTKLSPAAILASLGQLDGRRQPSTPALDYSRYVKRYGSALECGSSYCKDLGYREHFHCMDCSGRVFCKKEEMIRHFKWHKKRDDSLAHGFMRYSPLDDCGERGAGCPHNRSQTHYHCIQDGCDKVYISTSDVQMHANYHRKDSAILQEGFQRFRATERCSAAHCAFRGQRTTHFHCRRPGCKYTFKNKADMEKHKTYHIKDEQLARDGFKKYMKNEPCPYRDCRFSRMCNHIHCIRPRCNYVLHSSSQLFSHKRKHERKEQELSYSLPSSVIQNAMFQANSDDMPMKIKSSLSPKSSLIGDSDDNSVPSMYGPPPLIPMQSAMDLTSNDNILDHHQNLNQLVVDEITKKYIFTFNGGTDPNDKCQKCSAFNKHYHCQGESCVFAHSCQSTMMKHALEHEHQNQVTEAYFQTSTKSNSCNNSACQHIRDVTHYHCTWENCGCVILSSEEQPFRRLEHHRQHALLSPLSPPLARLAHALNTNSLQGLSPAALQNLPPSALQNLTPALQALAPGALQGLPSNVIQPQTNHGHPATSSSLDEMFSRKRGRPPKNRIVEVWADHATPQAIFTSFKLPKNNQLTMPPSPCAPIDDIAKLKFQHFDVYTSPDTCFINHPNCQLKSMKLHMHCSQCSFSSDNHTSLETHCRETHSVVQLLDGFDYYSSWEECNTRGCCKNQLRSHFHCTQNSQCGAILTQYSSLLSHKHIGHNMNMKIGDIDIKQESIIKSTEEVKDYSIKGKDSLSSLLNIKNVDMVTALENFQGGTLSLKSENVEGEVGGGVVKAAGTFYPSSHERTSGASPPTGTRTPTCPHCYRPAPDHAHLCPAHPPTYDTTALGLAATKETLEREYPEISILPSTAANSGTPPSPARQSNQINNQLGQNNQTNQGNQVVHSLLLQQYLAQATQGKPTGLQDPLKYQQLGLSGIPGLTPTQLAQMAFLSHRSPFPLYPGMMYPPELLMEQSGMIGPGSGMQTSSPLIKNEKDNDMINKRSHIPRAAPSMRMLKDEPIPEGYLRFRFNEDCAYQHCGYREHQTHFHCTRRDCGYSFCDKTRFVQHTARHERLDTLMGGDFQQYRANVFCGRQDCVHASNFGATQNKASHFHCLKCEFVCTDTNKVVAHRRQHQKMDSIQAAGFEKFPPSKGCGFDPQCIHSKKQTHYHCLQCGFAVLGLSQMTSHKYRHQETSQGGASTSGT
ncbi:zinc finger protein castor homolog 1-like isoform X2 [Arctopsyche grandis]|uniref:zinc finger protein castor homolog 1-like isoform X2 n=1 Tax=Arctopsyche grandis TaxID=121162 RepID=UPI00406D6AF4